jgi:hypothetical protein
MCLFLAFFFLALSRFVRAGMYGESQLLNCLVYYLLCARGHGCYTVLLEEVLFFCSLHVMTTTTTMMIMMMKQSTATHL